MRGRGGSEPAEATPIPNATTLAVVVDDAGAVYPVRIDPTFSDDNWFSMGPVLGANNYVNAAVADAAGNLYIGGNFTVVGDVIANYVAKWNGSAWSALGSGMNSTVHALAVLGTNLHAGGLFTTAGDKVSAYLAGAYIGPLGGQFGSVSYSPTLGCRFTFSDATVGQPYRIQTCGSMAGAHWLHLPRAGHDHRLLRAGRDEQILPRRQPLK